MTIPLWPGRLQGSARDLLAGQRAAPSVGGPTGWQQLTDSYAACGCSAPAVLAAPDPVRVLACPAGTPAVAQLIVLCQGLAGLPALAAAWLLKGVAGTLVLGEQYCSEAPPPAAPQGDAWGRTAVNPVSARLVWAEAAPRCQAKVDCWGGVSPTRVLAIAAPLPQPMLA